MFNIPITVIVVVILALGFDFINGFHDTANSIATTISTRVLSPKRAILLASSFNLFGAMFFTLLFKTKNVAGTIANDVVNNKMITVYAVMAALVAAIIWNLITWYFGIPSSSSHALIGSLIGASIAQTAGVEVLKWSGIFNKIIVPLFTSPVIGFLLGFSLMKLFAVMFSAFSQRTMNKWFSKLQLISAAAVAFFHGSNDAQKSMGIITMALITANLNGGSTSTQPWVVILCALAIAVGTSVGGWKIIKTVGMNMLKMQPVHGFAAQTSAAISIAIADAYHAPISTTHVITTAVMGVGASKRLSAVRWILAKNIVMAWILTIPITIILGALITFIMKLFVG
jgi:inorganic phosphate transporter, PiT family